MMITLRSPWTLFLLPKRFVGDNLTVDGNAVFIDGLRLYDDELSAREVRQAWVQCSGSLSISRS